MRRSFTTLAISALAALTLVGCGKEERAVAPEQTPYEKCMQSSSQPSYSLRIRCKDGEQAYQAAVLDRSQRITEAEHADEAFVWPGCGNCQVPEEVSQEGLDTLNAWLYRRHATCVDSTRPVLIRAMACSTVSLELS